MLVAVVGSLLVLIEAPLSHVMCGARPGASNPTVPTEEERTEVVTGVTQVRAQVRRRHHAVYQETVPFEPNRITTRSSFSRSRTPPTHRSFAGAVLPLRC
jgi:hypothetical protein